MIAASSAAGVEAAGRDSLWFADTQNLATDVFVSLGIAATATSRIALATGVTNPVNLHPAVAGPSAYCASRLAELVDLGLDRMVVVPGSRDADPSELLASVGRLAAEVLPQLR